MALSSYGSLLMSHTGCGGKKAVGAKETRDRSVESGDIGDWIWLLLILVKGACGVLLLNLTFYLGRMIPVFCDR